MVTAGWRRLALRGLPLRAPASAAAGRPLRTERLPFFAASTDAFSAASRSAGSSSSAAGTAVIVSPFCFALITFMSASR